MDAFLPYGVGSLSVHDLDGSPRGRPAEIPILSGVIHTEKAHQFRDIYIIVVVKMTEPAENEICTYFYAYYANCCCPDCVPESVSMESRRLGAETDLSDTSDSRDRQHLPEEPSGDFTVK